MQPLFSLARDRIEMTRRKRRVFLLEPLEERVQLSTTSPTSVSLGTGSLLASTGTQTVPLSITLASPEVDIAFLLDDTGSFDKQFGHTLEGIFNGIASTLQADFPNASFGYGLARFEDYGGPGTALSSDYITARPYLLDQPIVTAATAAAHGTTLDALMATAFEEIGQGNGGDTPEPDFEALYQIATGAGFDGNGDGSTLESGSAASVQAAISPGTSGDVPAFSSNVGITSGSLGGIGWRPGAEHIVFLATDTAPVTAFPAGTNPATAIITGSGGMTEPATDVESTSGRVGYVSTTVGSIGQGQQPAVVPLGGATVQQAVTALNSLGIQVVSMGPGAEVTSYPGPSTAPSPFFTALGNLTGALGTNGQPLVFSSTQASDGLASSIIGSVQALASRSPVTQPVSISLAASNLPAGLTFTPSTASVSGVAPGGTAAFNVTLTVNTVPFQGSFDARFTNSGDGTNMGIVPFVINLPTQSAPPSQSTPPSQTTQQPAIISAPTIVSGKRVNARGPTELALIFSTAMNAATVDNVANYVLTTPQGRIDPITQATYNASTNTVTLRTKLPVNLNRYYRLVVRSQASTGVRSAAGVALDGMKTGQAGNDYYGSIYRFKITPSRPQQPAAKSKSGRRR